MTGGQDWASELIESKGKSMGPVIEAEILTRLKKLEADSRLVKDTIADLLVENHLRKYPADTWKIATDALVKFFQGLPKEEPKPQPEPAAAPPETTEPKRHELWVNIYDDVFGTYSVYCKKEDAIKFRRSKDFVRTAKFIEAPTDAEIEEAVHVGVDHRLATVGTETLGDAIRHAIRHLLGREVE